MGNLCSIYHAHFDKLVALTNNHNKAVFLDKCLFWWQISTYTLDDEKVWFTRSIPHMAGELAIAERSVSRYLAEFEEKGLLERTCKLSSSNKNNQFKVTKRLYIRITEKFLQLLKLKSTTSDASEKDEDCSFLDQCGEIDNANLAGSLYKDKDLNPINNNTVSHLDNVNNLETTLTLPNKASNIISYPVESQIGERITEPLKNYIKGMLYNVKKQYEVHFSDPNKLFAEIVFSITQDCQWQGINDVHHRINVIAKILRKNQWKTPKGFYNHWDVGHQFRKKEQNRFKQAQQEKVQTSPLAEIVLKEDLSNAIDQSPRFDTRFNDEYRYSKPLQYEKSAEIKKIEDALRAIEQSLSSEEAYLKELELWFQQKNPCINQALIQSVALKVAKLYEEKEVLFEVLENMTIKAA